MAVCDKGSHRRRRAIRLAFSSMNSHLSKLWLLLICKEFEAFSMEGG
jgi:hypothetical protein